MAIQPLPAHGTLNWDIPLNSILAQLGNQWVPSDYSWLSWTFDPSQAANPVASGDYANGEVHMVKLWLRQTATVSNLHMFATAPGATLTAGQNFAALYDSTGTRVGVTADQSASWVTSGFKTMALTASANLAAGPIYIAILANGTTRPAWAREASTGPLNGALTAANYRASIGATAQTTMPASITMASRTATTLSWWGAVS